MKVLLLVGCAIVLIGLQPSEQRQQDEEKDLCSCIWYTSEKCECTEESKCDCKKCTRDKECKCVNELKSKTGAIRAKLNSAYARMAEGAIYIVEIKDRKFRLPSKNPVMDQKNLLFIPHVLSIMVGATVDFPNSDKVRHNVFSTDKSVKKFNLGQYPEGETKHMKFEECGIASLLCNVHAEMSAYIVVCQNPYFATTDKKTREAIIRNVPPGKYKLSFFHEKLQPKEIEVTVNVGKETCAEFKSLEKK